MRAFLFHWYRLVFFSIKKTAFFASISIIHSIDSDEKRIVTTSVNYVLSTFFFHARSLSLSLFFHQSSTYADALNANDIIEKRM